MPGALTIKIKFYIIIQSVWGNLYFFAKMLRKLFAIFICCSAYCSDYVFSKYYLNPELQKFVLESVNISRDSALGIAINKVISDENDDAISDLVYEIAQVSFCPYKTDDRIIVSLIEPLSCQLAEDEIREKLIYNKDANQSSMLGNLYSLMEYDNELLQKLAGRLTLERAKTYEKEGAEFLRKTNKEMQNKFTYLIGLIDCMQVLLDQLDESSTNENKAYLCKLIVQLCSNITSSPYFIDALSTMMHVKEEKLKRQLIAALYKATCLWSIHFVENIK